MAKRKSTRAARFSRNQRPRRRGPARRVAAAPKQAPAVSENAHSAIEVSRTKLMRARAVLDCIRYVLLYDDPGEDDPKLPSFFDAIDVARGLLDEVIEGLDRVNLRPTKKSSLPSRA